jgi:NADH-quinone oxidoreductase subunit E
MEALKMDGTPPWATPEMSALLSDLRKRYRGTSEALIPMLQKVQRAAGYLPEAALLEIAELTGLPSATVFGVATFYEQFRLQPVGRHIVRVCRGTACHVKGVDRILNAIEAHFRLTPGGTTDDGLFTLETVACFGSCALAPVVVVDDEVKGRMTPAQTRELLVRLPGEAHPAAEM